MREIYRNYITPLLLLIIVLAGYLFYKDTNLRLYHLRNQVNCLKQGEIVAYQQVTIKTGLPVNTRTEPFCIDYFTNQTLER